MRLPLATHNKRLSDEYPSMTVKILVDPTRIELATPFLQGTVAPKVHAGPFKNGSGGRIRTDILRLMRSTSYLIDIHTAIRKWSE